MPLRTAAGHPQQGIHANGNARFRNVFAHPQDVAFFVCSANTALRFAPADLDDCFSSFDEGLCIGKSLQQ
jgi:hypothetical protein